MFNPTNLNEVCVQETHIEMKGKKTNNNVSRKPFKPNGENSKGKEKR